MTDTERDLITAVAAAIWNTPQPGTTDSDIFSISNKPKP